MSFNVVVENDYSSGQNFTLVLSFDKDWSSSLNATIGPNSVKTFVLHWRALSTDTYSWFIGLWQSNDLKSWKNGTISVKPSTIEVTGWLKSNVSTTVTLGTKAHFDVYVKSLIDKFTYDFPVIIEYSYVDPAGKAHGPVTVVHSYVPQLAPKEEKNVTWFDFKFDTPGKYMFTLYVNGTPVDDKTITVNPKGDVVAWMECNPELVDETVDSISCNIYVKNNDSSTITLWVTDVYFAGGKIYDWSDTQHTIIQLSQNTFEVKPNSSGTLAFSIPLNDELQSMVPVDLSDINPMTPMAVKVYLNLLKNPLISVVEMNPLQIGLANEIKQYIVTKVQNDPWGTSLAVASFIVTGKLSIETNPAVLAVAVYIWSMYETFTTNINENAGDNNMIVGDGE